MAEPTKRNPKLIEGVWFPVRYVSQYHCFEDARFNLIGCGLIGSIATKLAGQVKTRRRISSRESKEG